MHHLLFEKEVLAQMVDLTDPSQVHHLKDVLRLKVGDEVTILDVSGKEYQASICKIGKKQIQFSLLKQHSFKTKAITIAMACAIPKGHKMDDIVDKLTQLGVDLIIPMETERGIVKLKNREGLKEERWRKVALGAVEQSHRSNLPLVTKVMQIDEVLTSSDSYDFKLIATLEGNPKSFKEVMHGIIPRSILTLIGPEGDFTPGEIKAALKQGFAPVSLGDSVLRVETAAIAVASYLRFTLME